MNLRPTIGFLAAIALAVPVAQAQTNVRIRGVISALDGNVLSVKSRDGNDLRLTLADNATVGVAKAVRFEDIKEGDLVGATTRRNPNGAEVAVEVHYLPPTVTQGQSNWDLAPDSKMTNAIVRAKVAATGARELTLEFPGGSQRIVVPDGIPLVRTVPGSRSDLVAGEYVFVSAQSAADGALTAARIQVSKDGVRPPQ